MIQYYIHHQGFLTILEGGCVYHKVTPETVGQYITTIGEHRVFDGDIYCIKDANYSFFVKIEDDLQAICYHLYKLEWDEKSCLRLGPLYRIKELGWENEFHITGNIHDNMELIGKEEL